MNPTSIALVGNPNVGKSVLFHRLTGAYVNVSNYPGTTVEISRAQARFDAAVDLVDTPGVLTLPARSDDERATMLALFDEPLRALVQVGDAKNLRRTLTLSALLAELGVPMVLALNMADEARARGVEIDIDELAATLAYPATLTVATGGKGVAHLTQQITEARTPTALLHYDPATELAIAQLTTLITTHAPHPRLAARGLAILYLGEDTVAEAWLHQAAGAHAEELKAARHAAHASGITPATLAHERGEAAGLIAARVTRRHAGIAPQLSQRVARWVIHPFWAWPVLLGMLFLVYEFVGVFGAGTLVGLFENTLFGEHLNPAVTGFVQQHVSVRWLSDLIVGPYGLWTMGMTYAIALILPIVTTFFIAFGMLEDSGYFARLSVLSNRLFKLFGLNGRAVLPMVLGLGCVTMATLTTRILTSPRERLITIFLMALAIPCSAQLGVVLGLLGGISFGATLIWLVAMVAVLIFAGFIAAKLIPGKRIPLVTEMPPMRLPLAGNVAKKTLGRLKWYLIEVIPLFLLGAFLMFLLDKAGVLPAIIRVSEPLVTGWLGLPKEAAAAFVMGFLRRDFGATGLFALSSQLTPIQAVVGMVTLTIFVPCIASLMMIIKEQGLKIAAAMLAIIIPFAFLVGGLLNQLLHLVWA